MVELGRSLALGLHDFQNPSGINLIDRCEPLREWVDATSAAGVFQFLRHHRTAPHHQAEVVGWGGQTYSGINLASQDYLGLSTHPDVVRAAADACLSHGTHSSGSEPMGGGLSEGRLLERELAEHVQHENVVLFPTGWAAGYGGIKSLIRSSDYIVMDVLAHDCLQNGARAATPNVSLFGHNDVSSLEKRLVRVRHSAPEAAILVVTESLFSLDSDHPDFREVIAVCRRHRAALLVDVAHDLGALGPRGMGVLAEQGVLSEVDFVMGSFSKSFGCIGGFFASHSKAVSYYVRGFSSSYTFSNYLMPAQIAAVRTALAIIRSDEGEVLRKRTLAAAEVLRKALTGQGLNVLGRLSPLVLPLVGAEPVARLAYRKCLEDGVILNNIEYPACRRGEARFRMQTTPQHEPEALRRAAQVIATAVACVREQVACRVEKRLA